METGADVAKKRKLSGTEKRRHGALARLDEELLDMAKRVAALRKITLAEYLTAALGPIVRRDLEKEAKKLTDEVSRKEKGD